MPGLQQATPPPLSLSSDCLHWVHAGEASAGRDAARGTRGAQVSPAAAPAPHGGAGEGAAGSSLPLGRMESRGTAAQPSRAAQAQMAGPQGRQRAPMAGDESPEKVAGPHGRSQPRGRLPALRPPRGLAAPRAPAAEQGPAGPGPPLPAAPAARGRPAHRILPVLPVVGIGAQRCGHGGAAPLPAGGGRK